jgi:lipopolysaccharide export system protein LptA
MADTVGQQTQRFSLSKTLADQTVYTIQAEQVTNYEDTGKALLTGVSVLIYGKDGSRRDSLSTRECVYDPAAGSLWVPGEVQMHFDVQLEGMGAEASPSERSAVVSLVTSQLSFEQSTGIASTEAPVRFTFPQGSGTALGATYDPKEQRVLLKANVALALQETSGGSASETQVRAGQVHFAKESGSAQRLLLDGTVVILQAGRQAQGNRGEIVLDEEFRAREATLEGDVVASENSAALSGELRAARADFRFGDSGRIQALNLTGDMLRTATWTMRSGSSGNGSGQTRNGEARHIALSFNSATGQLQRIVAEEAVRADFFKVVPENGRRQDGSGAAHRISGERAVMQMRPDGKFLERTEIMTGARLVIEPETGTGGPRIVAADQFDIAFGPGGDIADFRASGRVEMQEQAAANARQTKSDYLEATFHPQTGAPDRVRQWGKFQYRDSERQAAAAQADYNVASRQIALEGKPAVWNQQGRLNAATILLDTTTNGLSAEGGVSSTFLPQSKAGGKPAEPVHVTSDRLRYDAASKRSHFEGKAKLWQGESFLVEAASLEWNPADGELLARDRVYSVFRQLPELSQNGRSAAAAGGAGADRDQPITVRASLLRFERQRWLVHYETGVEMQSGAGKLTASQLDVYLEPSESQDATDLSLSAGRIQRAIAEGGVRVTERNRAAAGDRADYLPARGEVHLFGAPASVADAEKGRIEGSKLTYVLGDDSIRVEGKPGLPTDTRWQVP